MAVKGNCQDIARPNRVAGFGNPVAVYPHLARLY